MRQRTDDEDLKKFAVSCIRKSGSFEYTERTLRDLEAKGLAEIERLGGNEMLAGLFKKLAGIYNGGSSGDQASGGSGSGMTAAGAGSGGE